MTGEPMVPGQVLPGGGPVELNPGRDRTALRVENTGDRPVQVGSHFHFADANAALSFDRAAAAGKRLDIAALAAAGCNHLSHTSIDMAADSRLMLREQLVGGRSCDEESGRLRAELRVDRGAEPVLHQTLSIGPGAAFGSTYGRSRCVGTVLVVDASDSSWRPDVMDFPAPDTVVCALAARGGWLASALSADAATLRSQLGAARDHLVHQSREMITVP